MNTKTIHISNNSFTMKYLFKSFPFLFLFFLALNANSQLEYPEDKVSWKFSVKQNGDEATVVAKIKMVKHWHIYAAHLPAGSFTIPTNIVFEKSDNYKVLGEIKEPKPIFVHDEEADEDLYYHSNSIKMSQKIKILSEKDFTLNGIFSFQTCDDSHCLPPYETSFSIKVKGTKSDSESTKEEEETNNDVDTIVTSDVAKSTPVSTNNTNEIKKQTKKEATNNATSNNENSTTSKSIWMIFGLSFLSGLLALLTPCVFPMIPMTVSFFTKQSKTKAAGIRNALFYGISIIIIFVTLGTLVTAIFGSDALNALSTNVWFNLIFFALLIVFAVSFMGAFEITLPNSWVNKADRAGDRGGLIGIFFMALALALVSFSCTGPIVGTLLVTSASVGGIAPFIGMFGFSLALALPFSLFAAFPGWMNQLPKSGGWLNTVKVVLGFLELALAFKFLSNADLVIQGHFLERELFLAIWIGVFLVLALYLFGLFQLPHDSKLERLSVGRALLGTFTLVFVIYLIPGLWGAPLKLISGFPPPMAYSESPLGVGGGSASAAAHIEGEDTHPGPQNLPVFHDYDKGVAYAKKVGKPVFLDFTGHACVNCRKMEEQVWGEPGVIEILKDKVVIISLYVDEKTKLPEKEQKMITDIRGKEVKLKTVGQKWSDFQAKKYGANTQPYYRMLSSNGKDIQIGSADYEHHGSAKKFKAWLEKGLKKAKK